LDDIPDHVLAILQGISQIQSATRAWRGITSEIFNHPNFFHMSPSAGQRWNTLIHSLHAVDKQAFPELIARVSTASSTNLFSNKEAETASKALAIRRTAYAIFVGRKDSYITSLAIIQEKLAEVLRSGHSPVVLGEVSKRNAE
jgi:hypothetical protein